MLLDCLIVVYVVLVIPCHRMALIFNNSEIWFRQAKECMKGVGIVVFFELELIRGISTLSV